MAKNKKKDKLTAKPTAFDGLNGSREFVERKTGGRYGDTNNQIGSGCGGRSQHGSKNPKNH